MARKEGCRLGLTDWWAGAAAGPADPVELTAGLVFTGLSQDKLGQVTTWC